MINTRYSPVNEVFRGKHGAQFHTVCIFQHRRGNRYPVPGTGVIKEYWLEIFFVGATGL